MDPRERDAGLAALERTASGDADRHFVREPFPFDAEYDRALSKPLYGAIEVRFVSLPTLIMMKEAAGREQDRIDIAHLRMRLEHDAGQ